jgi:hypothetical protein
MKGVSLGIEKVKINLLIDYFMSRKFSVISIAVVMIFFVSIGNHVGQVFAQSGNATTTFSAQGTINSLTILSPTNKFVLGGTWSMNVASGKVTSFTILMTAVRANGTDFHTHQFINFHPGTNQIIQLTPTYSMSVPGTMDIALNRHVVWHGVNSILTIENGKILAVSVDDTTTSHHFAAQPIYGFIKSIAVTTTISNS